MKHPAEARRIVMELALYERYKQRAFYRERDSLPPVAAVARMGELTGIRNCVERARQILGEEEIDAAAYLEALRLFAMQAMTDVEEAQIKADKARQAYDLHRRLTEGPQCTNDSPTAPAK